MSSSITTEITSHANPFYLPPHKRAIFNAIAEPDVERSITIRPAGPIALREMPMNIICLTFSELLTGPEVRCEPIARRCNRCKKLQN